MMPGPNGIETARLLKARVPGVLVLFLTTRHSAFDSVITALPRTEPFAGIREGQVWRIVTPAFMHAQLFGRGPSHADGLRVRDTGHEAFPLAHLFAVRFGASPKCPKCGQALKYDDEEGKPKPKKKEFSVEPR